MSIRCVEQRMEHPHFNKHQDQTNSTLPAEQDQENREVQDRLWRYQDQDSSGLRSEQDQEIREVQDQRCNHQQQVSKEKQSSG